MIKLNMQEIGTLTFPRGELFEHDEIERDGWDVLEVQGSSQELSDKEINQLHHYGVKLLLSNGYLVAVQRDDDGDTFETDEAAAAAANAAGMPTLEARGHHYVVDLGSPILMDEVTIPVFLLDEDGMITRALRTVVPYIASLDEYLYHNGEDILIYIDEEELDRVIESGRVEHSSNEWMKHLPRFILELMKAHGMAGSRAIFAA